MAAGVGLNLPQARLPQPTVFDGTTPPLHEWIQETRNFLSISNNEFVRQMDYALQSDTEVSLQYVTNSTTRGRERRKTLDANERAQDALQDELTTPPAQRAAGRTDRAINDETDVLQNAHAGLEDCHNEEQDRVSREGDYLNYVLIPWRQRPTTTFVDCKEVQMNSKHYDFETTLQRRSNATKLPAFA